MLTISEWLQHMKRTAVQVKARITFKQNATNLSSDPPMMRDTNAQDPSFAWCCHLDISLLKDKISEFWSKNALQITSCTHCSDLRKDHSSPGKRMSIWWHNNHCHSDSRLQIIIAPILLLLPPTEMWYGWLMSNGENDRMFDTLWLPKWISTGLSSVSRSLLFSSEDPYEDMPISGDFEPISVRADPIRAAVSPHPPDERMHYLKIAEGTSSFYWAPVIVHKLP